jgi:ribonucleoside-diphosphate reductase alpha chain
MFLDDSACNLASLNLMKFADGDGRFNIESFRKAVDITIRHRKSSSGTLLSHAEDRGEFYAFRPGLNYANLGALLMSEGSMTATREETCLRRSRRHDG